MMKVVLPQTKKGRRSYQGQQDYEQQLQQFADVIKEIESRLQFPVSARGWCYILEEHGLTKGEFSKIQDCMVECRKKGLLPIGICAEDRSRTWDGLERLDDTPEIQANSWISYLNQAWMSYSPISFWDYQDCYLEMMVEKIDLKYLFNGVCKEYKIAIANAKGRSDLNMRAEMMKRFQHHESQGRKPVLLYCGDHDPMGLAISNELKSNIQELSDAVGWHPDRLIIHRFGLNADFIEVNQLSWIDNLETGSGDRLDDPKHKHHNADYVQSYIKQFGIRKCEANALVTRPEAGKALCRNAIAQFIKPEGIKRWQQETSKVRQQYKQVLQQQLVSTFGNG